MPRRFGWKPDLPDVRDWRYRATFAEGKEVPFWARAAPCLGQRRFPAATDLLQYGPQWPGVFDQGQLGSCVENAWVAALAFVLGKEGGPAPHILSRLFLYYEVRGGTPEDTGSSIRDGIKTVAQVGDCAEASWPYDLERWTQRPSALCYEEAARRKGVTYARLSGLDDMLDCLASGYPFVFGMSVYESFETVDAEDDVLRLPRPSESLLGGHALCAVGYDRGRALFRVRNSWGEGWGNGGFFWLPFSYAADRNLADDFWTVRQVPAVG